MNIKDKAYTSNYPDLEEWIHGNEGRCAWQILHGDQDAFHSYVELWQFEKGQAIVLVHSHHRGWDIFTPCRSNKVTDTLEDAYERISKP